MINNKDMENKDGRTVHFIKESINQVKSKEKVHLFGEMTAPIKDNSNRTTFMEKVNMFGKMVGFSKGNGITTKCMEKVYLYGRMDVDMKEIIRMIKNMGSGSLLLRMEEFIRDNGQVESNTGEEGTKRRK